MGNTSAGNYSDRNKRFEYQVFLSFRGPDTRRFVGHLRDALDKTRFKIFFRQPSAGTWQGYPT
ncbi:unnamed protein product [Rhodiola kirilowii]